MLAAQLSENGAEIVYARAREGNDRCSAVSFDFSSGLNDGDRVVTDGQYKLQANTPVTVNQAPSGAPGRSTT